MKFIRKKNFQEGEELLYTPRLHWMYVVRHMVLSLPFFLVLLILWIVVARNAGASWYMDSSVVQMLKFAIKSVFLVSLIIVLLDFVWHIFLYLCTEYGVTNRRLLIKKGIIRMVVGEIPTDRIESIYCLQGLMGRIFHYGTICISGVGGRMPVFYMVSRPYAMRRKIVEIIEKNKTINVIQGDLPKAKPVEKPEPIIEEEPLYRYGTFVRVIPESEK